MSGMGPRKRAKGAKTNKGAEKLWCDWKSYQGYQHVHRALRAGHGTFTFAHDIWGVGDGLVMDCSSGVEVAQVKSHEWDLGRARRKMEAISWAPGVRVLMVIHVVEGEKKAAKHFWYVEELLRDYEYRTCPDCGGTAREKAVTDKLAVNKHDYDPARGSVFMECSTCGGRGNVAIRIRDFVWVRRPKVAFDYQAVAIHALEVFRAKRRVAKEKKAGVEARRLERLKQGKPLRRRKTTNA